LLGPPAEVDDLGHAFGAEQAGNDHPIVERPELHQVVAILRMELVAIDFAADHGPVALDQLEDFPELRGAVDDMAEAHPRQ